MDTLHIAAGNVHLCAVVDGGRTWCWGNNNSGELGDGTTTTTTTRNTPVQVSGLDNAVDTVTGMGHSCALLATDEIQCWGGNYYGTLGDGTETSRSVPVTVAGLSDVVKISSSADHTCALRYDGTVWCWGLNKNGSLGVGTTEGPEGCPSSHPNEAACSHIPVQVVGL